MAGLKQRSPLRTWIEYVAARAVMASLSVGPRSWADHLANFYVRLLDRAVPKLRRTAYRNLEMALPGLTAEERERIANGSFRSIARVLTAMARFGEIGKTNVRTWIDYEGFEHFEASVRRGKGILFATAHLGNWELSAFAHALLAAPMHVVVRPLDNPRIDALVERLRTMSGNQVLGKRDFARGILRALGRNEAVGVLVDQNTSADEGVFVPFFGIPACVGTGFAKFAAHSGAAVIPGYALWSERLGRYVLKFYEPIHMTGDVTEDTRRVQAHLESVIRQYPDQWLWMHRRWKTRPAGEPDLYAGC